MASAPMRIPTPVGSRPPSRTRPAPPPTPLPLAHAPDLDLSHLSLSPPEFEYSSSLSPPGAGVGESPPLATPPTPALFNTLAARGKAPAAVEEEPEAAHTFRDGFSNSYGLWEARDEFDLDRLADDPTSSGSRPRAPPAPSPPPQLPQQTFAPLYSPTSAPGGDDGGLVSPAASTTSATSSSTSRSIGAAVRRRLDSSKRLWRRGGDEEGGAAPPASLALGDADPSPMSRLRTTLRPRLRTNSSSMAESSSTSSFFSSFAISPAASTSSAASSPVLRSFPPPPDDGNMEQQPPLRSSKLFTRPRQQGLRRRSTLGLAGLSLTQVEPAAPLQPRPFSVVVSSAGVRASAPEATTAVGTDELVWGTLSYRAVPEPPKVDLFSTMLPRELKVAVFKALLAGWTASGTGGRLEGENGGRKELIRLSRVSKEWRSLAYDGQLWANFDLTAFSGKLHPSTMRQILRHSRPFVRTLTCQGMETLPGSSLTGRDLLDLWSTDSYPVPRLSPTFSSLTTLDVRGAHGITTPDLIAIVQISPALKKLNLKGSALHLSLVLSAVADNVDGLEELDVSRCWSLEFLDIEAFVTRLNAQQRAALKSLRLAGLPAATTNHLLQKLAALPNLHTLDLLGCRWLAHDDMQEYIEALGGRPSPLRHLVISSCTNLTTEAIELLVGHVPEMRMFEAANLEAVFYIDPPPTLARLVRSMPKIERLDLEGTGRYGGVCDRMLYELIPGACPGSALEVSQLVELRIGSAKHVTTQALATLVANLPRLSRLEADGTEADNALVRAFLAKHGRDPDAALCLVDCHRLTPEIYPEIQYKTRARAGWDNYQAVPFTYSRAEAAALPVIKTFWAWRKVAAPKPWRDAREHAEDKRRGSGELTGRRGSTPTRLWWRDVDEIERGACLVQ
ncbi:hypothetical protein Q8F55_001868 [Vanrija albida]|uniref:F-box domain-containing protein n=1 Tax=Vanrija albida TaxID=181172 RepID=A0ABR3Q858_9TREE